MTIAELGYGQLQNYFSYGKKRLLFSFENLTRKFKRQLGSVFSRRAIALLQRQMKTKLSIETSIN